MSSAPSPALAAPAPPGIAPGSVAAWVLACRPATLTAAVAPVLVGTACAHHAGAFDVVIALSALLGAMFLQIGSNLANDVFDYEKGADTSERLGPPRAAQMGLLSPAQLRRGMALSFALATAVGVHLTVVAGPVIVVIGILSILSAIAYTGGPYPLGYNGLGDLFVIVFFGFVAVCGSAFVQLHQIPPLAIFASIPMGALITNILVVNNVRDLPTDIKSGKRTLPVRFGRNAGVSEYALMVFAAYATPLGLVVTGQLGPWALLPLLVLPLSLQQFMRLRREAGRALNAVLVASAKLVFLFAALFALGIRLS